MVMKHLQITIDEGRLVLPQEVLDILPSGIPLDVIIDSERGTVCVHAKDSPARSAQFQTVLDGLDDLNEGVSQEDYFKPAPLEQLRRPRRDDDSEGAAG